MNPILSALISSPAVADASRRAMNELIPVVERSLKGMRAGKLVGVAGPTILTSCFAAGVAVGWMTAPAKGSETRARFRAGARKWADEVSQRAQAGKQYISDKFAKGEADAEVQEAGSQKGARPNGEGQASSDALAH